MNRKEETLLRENLERKVIVVLANDFNYLGQVNPALFIKDYHVREYEYFRKMKAKGLQKFDMKSAQKIIGKNEECIMNFVTIDCLTNKFKDLNAEKVLWEFQLNSTEWFNLTPEKNKETFLQILEQERSTPCYKTGIKQFDEAIDR